MPAYDYNEGGKIVTRILPVEMRDAYPGRVKIPIRIAVCPRGAPTQGQEVLNGWYKCEERLGSRAVRNVERELGLNSSKVKKLWKDT